MIKAAIYCEKEQNKIGSGEGGPNAGVQPRRYSKIGNALKMSVAYEMVAILLDAQRRRLERDVGRRPFWFFFIREIACDLLPA